MLQLNPAALPRKQDSAPAQPQHPAPPGYDQVGTWKSLMIAAAQLGGAAPDVNQIISDAEDKLTSLGFPDRGVIVHMVFDRSVVPSGGLLYRTAVQGTAAPRVELIEAMGYILKDGKIAYTDDGSPIGKAYRFLEEWSDDALVNGEIEGQVAMSASRNGSILFMDDTMAAFGVRWLKRDKKPESVAKLIRGFEGRGIAKVLAIDIQKMP